MEELNIKLVIEKIRQEKKSEKISLVADASDELQEGISNLGDPMACMYVDIDGLEGYLEEKKNKEDRF